MTDQNHKKEMSCQSLGRRRSGTDMDPPFTSVVVLANMRACTRQHYFDSQELQLGLELRCCAPHARQSARFFQVLYSITRICIQNPVWPLRDAFLYPRTTAAMGPLPDV